MKSPFAVTALAVLMLTQAGCCVSYSKLAAVRSDRAPVSLNAQALVKLIGKAVRPIGSMEGPQQSVAGGMTIYTVRSGDNAVEVLIHNQALAIKIERSWRTKPEFAARVQGAIEREFEKTYRTSLRFEDAPCGWLGP